VLPQSPRRRDWKSTLLIVGLIAPIVTVSIVAYNTWYNVPVMTYEILPAYPVSQQEQAVALIVRNEGAASATDVRIVIRGSGPDFASFNPDTRRMQDHNARLNGGRYSSQIPSRYTDLSLPESTGRGRVSNNQRVHQFPSRDWRQTYIGGNTGRILHNKGLACGARHYLHLGHHIFCRIYRPQETRNPCQQESIDCLFFEN